jgi:hypothetical protein
MVGIPDVHLVMMVPKYEGLYFVLASIISDFNDSLFMEIVFRSICRDITDNFQCKNSLFSFVSKLPKVLLSTKLLMSREQLPKMSAH